MSNLSLGEIYQNQETQNSTDFTGFWFNGTHSSLYNIIRISGGSRYQENLLPSISDQTVQVPGRDETYYFGTYYTQRTFSISFAFDSLTEQKFRNMRKWLNSKQMGLLTFDETPYKSYQVKVSDSGNIQYICFGETGEERIYKGEGTIQFIAYYPFGICSKKYFDLYLDNNKEEWKESAHLLNSQGSYDAKNSKNILIYNPGDLETDFKAYYQFTGNSLELNSIYISSSALTLGQLNFSGDITKKGNDVYLKIDSETELLEGCDENKEPTGNLYNEYITTGEFFKIPTIDDNNTSNTHFVTDGANCVELDYNYLYF